MHPHPRRRTHISSASNEYAEPARGVGCAVQVAALSTWLNRLEPLPAKFWIYNCFLVRHSVPFRAPEPQTACQLLPCGSAAARCQICTLGPSALPPVRRCRPQVLQTQIWAQMVDVTVDAAAGRKTSGVMLGVRGTQVAHAVPTPNRTVFSLAQPGAAFASARWELTVAESLAVMLPSPPPPPPPPSLTLLPMQALLVAVLLAELGWVWRTFDDIPVRCFTVLSLTLPTFGAVRTGRRRAVLLLYSFVLQRHPDVNVRDRETERQRETETEKRTDIEIETEREGARGR